MIKSLSLLICTLLFLSLSVTVSADTFTFPKQLLHIESEAFANNKQIESIILPENLLSIGDNAFTNCTNLNSIKLPDSLQSIGTGVFSGCSKLNSIEIPNSVASIADGAFTGISKDFVVYGNSGSYAEEYCDHHFIYYLDRSKINSYPYTITFYNDYEIFDVKRYTYADNLIIPSATPTKYTDYINTYEFIGWIDNNSNPAFFPNIVKKNIDYYAQYSATAIPYVRRYFTQNSNHRYYVNIPSYWKSSKLENSTNSYISGTTFTDSFTIEIGHDMTTYGRSTYAYLTTLRKVLDANYDETGTFKFNEFGTYYGVTYNSTENTYSKKYTFNMGGLNSLFYIKADNMTPEQLNWFEHISSTFARATEEEFLIQQ